MVDYFCKEKFYVYFKNDEKLIFAFLKVITLF